MIIFLNIYQLSDMSFILVASVHFFSLKINHKLANVIYWGKTRDAHPCLS